MRSALIYIIHTQVNTPIRVTQRGTIIIWKSIGKINIYLDFMSLYVYCEPFIEQRSFQLNKS